MTNAFSWQNSISFCLASFCTPSNLCCPLPKSMPTVILFSSYFLYMKAGIVRKIYITNSSLNIYHTHTQTHLHLNLDMDTNTCTYA